ncbi:MAG TPA: hypothetical protein VMN56_03995 [Casimicrobiaceae bacterium]|nr:hypothetical protein [Casimicrobiaceae bacterium]
MPAAKKRPARPRAASAVKATRAFRNRWREFTGAAFSPNKAYPAALLSSIATLRGGAAAGLAAAPAAPVNTVVVTARRVQGNGCEKVAEIAGFYERTFAPQAPVILGPAGVKAVLDAAAKKLCCDTLKCPEDRKHPCPCTYIPQAKLAAYRLTATSEEGYLLQDKRVWNCRCGDVTP